jgi:CPA1 family monovalent cation:H+ antiporter
MLSTFEIAALLLTLTAALSWLNLYLIHLPRQVGLLLMALAASLVLLAFEWLFPSLAMPETLRNFVEQIDFHSAVMNGMLVFLLFAGALQIDVDLLKDERWTVALMATVGVLISTAVVGVVGWLVAGALGYHLPLAWALTFGALISPTDPVAVLSLIKYTKLPRSLEAKIAGESLFNDGVSVVVFTVFLAIAIGVGKDAHPEAGQVAWLFLAQGVGGGALGLFAGWVGYRAISAIDQHTVATMVSLAVATATYAVALRLGVSGPIAVVVAGLIIGSRPGKLAMGQRGERYIFATWELIEELLNSVLFLLIGLEVLVVRLDPALAWFAVASIPIVLLARLTAVAIPLALIGLGQPMPAGSIPVLTWGGLRGGISVALALSMPNFEEKPLILAATYAVVVFSVVVQGLSMRWVIGKTVDPKIIGTR